MTSRKKKLKIINKFKFMRALFILIMLILIIIKLITLFINHIININNENEAILNYSVSSLNYVIEIDDENNEPEYIEFSNKPINMSDEYYNYVVQAAKDNNIPITVILAIMTTENESYDPYAKSKNDNDTYDMGLCQVNSNYYEEFGKKYNIDNFNPYDPKQAIEFIAKHMKYLSDYGIENYNLSDEDSYIFAAGAYNRGLGNECKYRNMYDYKEKFINNYKTFL